MDVGARCDRCKFWAEHASECRKKPPEIQPLGVMGWPEVPPDEWCGEFVARHVQVKPPA